MQEAKYTVTQGDASADISVSRAAGQVLANVNRWRGQVGLNPVASEEEAGAKEVTVSSLPGKLFRFDGETKSMVVAMIPKGSGAWFFKLFGNKVVVEKEATAFEAYLSTIKIK